MIRIAFGHLPVFGLLEKEEKALGEAVVNKIRQLDLALGDTLPAAVDTFELASLNGKAEKMTLIPFKDAYGQGFVLTSEPQSAGSVRSRLAEAFQHLFHH